MSLCLAGLILGIIIIEWLFNLNERKIDERYFDQKEKEVQILRKKITHTTHPSMPPVLGNGTHDKEKSKNCE
jgi:hypothetical protein